MQTQPRIPENQTTLMLLMPLGRIFHRLWLETKKPFRGCTTHMFPLNLFRRTMDLGVICHETERWTIFQLEHGVNTSHNRDYMLKL